jgi:predicted GH43/DUF377 family glycosyl hydrolase
MAGRYNRVIERRGERMTTSHTVGSNEYHLLRWETDKRDEPVESLDSYWNARYISEMSAVFLTNTSQRITLGIVGTGQEGTSLEYSIDSGATWTVKGTSVNTTFDATGLTAGVVYFWRARLYKGTNYAPYCTPIRSQITNVAFTDDFTGSTIDTNKWTITNPDSVITQNGTLNIANTGSNTAMFRNNVKSIATVANGGVAVVQSHVTWSGTYAGEAVAGLYLYKDSTNYAYIGDRTVISPGNTYQLYVYTGGVQRYQFGSTVSKDKDVKIWTDGTNVKFFYWEVFTHVDGGLAGQWTQIGTTQTFSISGPYYAVLSNEQNFPTWSNTLIFDNVSLSSNDYIANFPNYTIQADPSPVWLSQGTVLTGLVSGNLAGACESTILYEGNPQILTGATNVFKMWYTNGNGGSVSLCYAESLTGLPDSWSKYATPLIAPCRCPDLIKVSGVYYFIVANGTTMKAFDLYTSSDGVNLTLDTANVLLAKATAGWDYSQIANKNIIYNAGTYYMFYEASDGVLWKTGLATSPDLRTWTKYGTTTLNLQFAGMRGGPQVIKSGSTFYLWGHGTDTTVDRPTDLFYRYKSTDLITWVKDTVNYVFTRKTSDEGVGISLGQVADIHLIEVNGKVYMFYSATADIDQHAPDFLHLKVAIANMTLAQLVLTEEGRI